MCRWPLLMLVLLTGCSRVAWFQLGQGDSGRREGGRPGLDTIAPDAGSVFKPDRPGADLAANPTDVRRPDTPDLTQSGTTWNPNDKHKAIQLSADRLEAFEPASPSSYNDSVRATAGRADGKRYFEVTVLARGASSYNQIGLATKYLDLDLGPSEDAAGGCGFSVGGLVGCLATGTFVTSSSGYQVGDVIGVAADLDADVVYFARNGIWLAGANPALGSGGVKLSTKPNIFFPVANLSTGDRVRANFGATPFAHPLPAGFTAGW